MARCSICGKPARYMRVINLDSGGLSAWADKLAFRCRKHLNNKSEDGKL